jgi:hypothetical protein
MCIRSDVKSAHDTSACRRSIAAVVTSNHCVGNGSDTSSGSYTSDSDSHISSSYSSYCYDIVMSNSLLLT